MQLKQKRVHNLILLLIYILNLKLNTKMSQIFKIYYLLIVTDNIHVRIWIILSENGGVLENKKHVFIFHCKRFKFDVRRRTKFIGSC